MSILPILDEWFIESDAHCADTYTGWLEQSWTFEGDDDDPEWNVWVGFFCINDEEAFE